MKKILFLMSAFILLLASCSPIDDKGSAMDADITSDYLASCVKVVQKSAGDNNFTFTTDKALPIQVCDGIGSILGYGTQGSFQVLPWSGNTLTYRYINSDGSIVTAQQEFTISQYTNVSPTYAAVFGADYGKITWVWDTDNVNGVWGNGASTDTNPNWWKVMPADIDGQTSGKGLPDDGLNGWFSIDCSNGLTVETSRGETGTVSLNPTVTTSGWDIGSLTFSGTIPLLGVQPNVAGNPRQYTYFIIYADGGDHLVLACKDDTDSSGGTCWFWCFKRQGL